MLASSLLKCKADGAKQQNNWPSAIIITVGFDVHSTKYLTNREATNEPKLNKIDTATILYESWNKTMWRTFEKFLDRDSVWKLIRNISINATHGE